MRHLAHGRDTDIEFVDGSFCGGIGVDIPVRNALALDSQGNILFAAFTTTPNMPVTTNADQPFLNGMQNYYFALLSPQGTPLYASYYGYTGVSNPVVAFSSGDQLVLAGTTTTSGFPVSPGAHLTSFPGPLCQAYEKLPFR